MSLTLLAIDLGKRSFHCHAVDDDGVIISRKTSRAKLLETIQELAPRPSRWRRAPARTIGADAFLPMVVGFF